MTSLLILSHSRKVAEAVEELVLDLNSNISVFAVGGTKDGSAGADYDRIKEELEKAIGLGEVVVLFDLGSTMLTVQTVIDELSEEDRANVFLSDAALVEGAIAASVGLGVEVPADEIMSQLQELSLDKF